MNPISSTASLPSAAHLAILRTRALDLARPMEATLQTEVLDLVEFSFATGRYAVEARFVHEAYPLRGITALPSTPAWICGVVNVRSQVLTAVDIRQWLGLGRSELKSGGKMIIMEADGWQFAMPVDTLIGAVQVPTEVLQSGEMTSISGPAAFVRGVTAERLTVLDAVRIFADERMSANYAAG